MIYKYSTRQLLKKFINSISEFKRQLIIAIILMVISIALLTYAPKLLGKVLNRFLDVYVGLKPFDAGDVLGKLVDIILIYVAGLLIQIPINRIMSKISEKNNYNLRVRLYEKLDTLPFDRFNCEY